MKLVSPIYALKEKNCIDAAWLAKLKITFDDGTTQTFRGKNILPSLKNINKKIIDYSGNYDFSNIEKLAHEKLIKIIERKKE